MKRRVATSSAVVDNNLSSLLQHNEDSAWKPKSDQQRRMMKGIVKQRAAETRGRRLVSLKDKEMTIRRVAAEVASRTTTDYQSPPYTPRTPRTPNRPSPKEGDAASRLPVQHRKKASVAAANSNGPCCAAGHTLHKIHGTPADYTHIEGNSVVCDRCGTKELQREPNFYHCPECKFDSCTFCVLGKKTKKAAPDAAPREGRATPQGKRVIAPLEGTKDVSEGLKLGSDVAGTRMRAEMVTLPNGKKHQSSAPTIEDADTHAPRGENGLSMKQSFPVGEEVEVKDLTNPLYGHRGVVTGFNRGRAGIQINGEQKGLLPFQIGKPGEGTKHSSLHPKKYKPGTVIEICNTASDADGKRGHVVTNCGNNVEVKLDDMIELYRLPRDNITLPLGTSVFVKENSSRKSGRITGYNRGRVGVALDSGKQIGVVPEIVRMVNGPPSTVCSTPSTSPPSVRGTPGLAPDSEPRITPQLIVTKNMLNSLRSALVHSSGPLAFVSLRAILAKLPATEFGLKQAFLRLGLQDIAHDRSLLYAIYEAFCQGGFFNGNEMVNTLRRRIPERRDRWILKSFSELDEEGTGYVPLQVLKKHFVSTNSNMSPSHFFDRSSLSQAEFAEFYRDLRFVF